MTVEKALFFTPEKARQVAQGIKADAFEVYRVVRSNQVLGYAVKLIRKSVEVDLMEGMVQ